jgi:hypothetical protein
MMMLRREREGERERNIKDTQKMVKKEARRMKHSIL